MAIEFTNVDRFLDCLRSDQGRSGVDIALEMHNVSPRSGLPAVQRLQGELLNFLYSHQHAPRVVRPFGCATIAENCGVRPIDPYP